MRTERSTAQARIARYTRLNYRPQKLAFHKPILRLWRATAPSRFRKMLIPVQAPAEKTSGPVAQHGYVARSNAKEHTTDNRGVVNPDDVQSTEFKSLRAHHKPTYTFPILSARFLDVDTLFGTRSSSNIPSNRTNLRIVSIEYFGTIGIRKWKPSAPDVLIM